MEGSQLKPIIIIGGGIAGLATAYELHRRGLPFVVLEASGRAGGVILSEQIDGFTIDGGPDALLVQKPEGVALCHELGLGERLMPTKPPRNAFIQRGGVLHALPASSVLGIPTRVGPFVQTRLFSWGAKLRMATEVVQKPRRGDDESIGAFIRRHFGGEAVDYLAEPLLAGIHAGDVERLSIQSLFPRFVEAERARGSLLRAFRNQARERTDGAFRSLPDGLSELVQAIVAALPPGSIRLNTPVTRIERMNSENLANLANLANPANPENLENQVRLRVLTGAGEALSSAAVVVATPSYIAARVLRETSADLARFCDEIGYSSTATIALAFPKSAVHHPLNGSGFVVPRVERSGILAATWLSSKWAHRAPEDRVLMRAFVGGARDPESFDRSDRELVALALTALRPLLGIEGEPLFTRVYRWERASAQHDVGHLARMRAIERQLQQIPGLFVTGSGFRGVGIPDCIADGRATGAKVATLLAIAGSL